MIYASCIQKTLIIRRCAGVVVCVYLQHYGELLRRISVLHTHGQPDLKRRELLCKERTVLWTQAAEVTKILELLLRWISFSLTHTHSQSAATSSSFHKKAQHNELRGDTALQQQHKSRSIMISLPSLWSLLPWQATWLAARPTLFDHAVRWNYSRNHAMFG